MKKTANRMWRGVVCGGLSFALLGGVALPITALAAGSCQCGTSSVMMQHRPEFKAMHEKMLAKAKAEDAALEKLVAELNQAPEAKKPDLEAAILNKLVAQHHEMLGEWESMHSRMMAMGNQHMQAMGKTETSTSK
jgi:hypothetical protein